MTSWVSSPACKHGKQTFSHFCCVVLWTLHWAKNTTLPRWASTVMTSSSQSLIWNWRVQTQQLAFEISKRKFDSKQQEGKLLSVTRQKRLTLMRSKVLVLGASFLSSFLKSWLNLQNEKGIYRFCQKKRTKKKTSPISCLSPCFTLFVSHEPSKCELVAKTQNASHEIARKSHLKSKTSKSQKKHLSIYGHSKKAGCRKVLKSCKVDWKTAAKMSPGNVGLSKNQNWQNCEFLFM